jgi:hypothetical protein
MEPDKEDRQGLARQQQLKGLQVSGLTFYRAYSLVLEGCKAPSSNLKILRPR